MSEARRMCWRGREQPRGFPFNRKLSVERAVQLTKRLQSGNAGLYEGAARYFGLNKLEAEAFAERHIDVKL